MKFRKKQLAAIHSTNNKEAQSYIHEKNKQCDAQFFLKITAKKVEEEKSDTTSDLGAQYGSNIEQAILLKKNQIIKLNDPKYPVKDSKTNTKPNGQTSKLMY